jgi:hypothetical protein
MKGCSVNNELRRVWKEMVFAKFEIWPQHMPGRPEENHYKLAAG